MNSLNQLKEFINCDWYFNNDISINKYYKINKKAYRLFHSKNGFMHMSISFDDKMHKEGEFYQPNTVESYIKENTKNILELGCGQGANLYYLGKRHANINFQGIDLQPSIDKSLDNVNLMKGDYHFLDKIETNSQDIVYAFETLCYSKDKAKIFKEVNRVLKDNGVFIIFDGYAKRQREELTKEEKEIMILVEKGMALEEFEYYKNISHYAKDNNFKEEIVVDLSKNVIPNMRRFKRIVVKGMKLGFFFKILCKILPKAFVGNAISGYLMMETLERNIFGYMEHIYRK